MNNIKPIRSIFDVPKIIDDVVKFDPTFKCYIHPVVLREILGREYFNRRTKRDILPDVYEMRRNMALVAILTNICCAYAHGKVNPEGFKRDIGHNLRIIRNFGVYNTTKSEGFSILFKEQKYMGVLLSDYFNLISIGYKHPNGDTGYNTYAFTQKMCELAEAVRTSKEPLYRVDLKVFDKVRTVNESFAIYDGKSFPHRRAVRPYFKEKYGRIMTKEEFDSIPFIRYVGVAFEDLFEKPETLHSYLTEFEEKMNRRHLERLKKFGKPHKEHTVRLNRSALMECHTLALREEAAGIRRGSCFKGIKQSSIIEQIIRCTGSDGVYRLCYYQSKHGRFYTKGLTLQNLCKEYRKKILQASGYVECDMVNGAYSVACELAKEYDMPIEDYLYTDLYAKYTKEFREYMFLKGISCDFYTNHDFVKRILLTIGYGANNSFYRVFQDYKNETANTMMMQLKPEKMERRNILNYSRCPEFSGLSSDLRRITKVVCKANTKVTGKGKTKTKILYNCLGQPMKLDRYTSFGRKYAHIYQGVESRILQSICDLKIRGKKLIDTRSGVGLLLHDGIYLHKSILKELELAGIDISEYVKQKTGYGVRFSIEKEDDKILEEMHSDFVIAEFKRYGKNYKVCEEYGIELTGLHINTNHVEEESKRIAKIYEERKIREEQEREQRRILREMKKELKAAGLIGTKTSGKSKTSQLEVAA